MGSIAHNASHGAYGFALDNTSILNYVSTRPDDTLSWYTVVYVICTDGPEKNGSYIRSAQMTHTNVCVRLVKGLYEP